MESESIDRIIDGCINSEPRYQRMIYERFRGYACRLVFRYIYRYEKAMDVVTDGFVKAFTHFSQFRKPIGGDSEKLLIGWLKQIMINTAIDELRRHDMSPEIGGIPEQLWQLPDKSANAELKLLYKDLIGLVKELPPNYRIVFNLYVIDGYTHNEIAELMNVPVGTSKSCLSRARTILQSKLRKMNEIRLCRI